jgi:CubicO group peptidase (beta-lactamase class C family)
MPVDQKEKMDTSAIKQAFFSGLGTVFPAATLELRQKNGRLGGGFTGWLDPENEQHPAYFDSLFDLGSVSKLFVCTAFMTLVEEQKVGLDQPVCTVLPEFSGMRPITAAEDPLKPGRMIPGSRMDEQADAGKVTFRNLLAHNSGLPAWGPLYRKPGPEHARQAALASPFFYPTGTRSVYSDIGLILLGMAMETLGGLRLDELVYERVTRPLKLHSTCYLPIGEGKYDPTNIAPTGVCAWRGRRMVGEVHDENAARLGGIAGHAGLFSTAADLVWFGQMFLDGGAPILRPETVAEMTRVQAQDGALRRGLGFGLWSPDPESSGNPFSQSAFGHTGFSGTSLWIDPERKLVVALLTNRVYFEWDASGIRAYRLKLHRAVVDVADKPSL